VVVGILQLELAIDGARSLKDKRRVLESLKARLHRRHGVSVAEVAEQDRHAVGVLGVAVAAEGTPRCQQVIDRVLEEVHATRGCMVRDQQTEILSGR